MTAAAERSLFAAKGRAAPVGAGPSAEAEVADAAADGPAAPRQLEPVPNTASEAPAGSLLSFRLRSAPNKPVLTEELKVALTRTAPSESGPAPEPYADPAGTAAAEANRQEARAQGAAPQAQAPTAVPVAAPVPPAPVPPPATAARIDTPLFPQPRRAREVPLAARAPVRYTPPPAAAWRTALPIGGAVLAIATVGWLISRSEPPGSAVPAAVPVAAEPVLAAAEPQLPSAEAEATVPQATVAEAAVAEAATPAPVAEEMPEADGPGPAMPDSAPAEIVPPIMPSFEVVRVAPDAPPVIAGRAAPGSELIVLDNGTMIGTARADANGEWAMVAGAPLPAGRHELTLAIATAEGAIVVEQADVRADAAPAGAGDLPYPAHKPVAGPPASIAYMVQLASVPSAADAEREWTRLQQAYAAQLDAAEAEIDAVEISGRGTFYRVRTGPFADRETAHQLCRELDAAGQECLVVRQAASQ